MLFYEQTCCHKGRSPFFVSRLPRWTVLLLLVASLAGALPAGLAAEERSSLLERLEELIGIPLTLSQREAIAEASQEMIRALRERQRAFVAGLKERGTIPTAAEKALTPIDGLPFDFDQDALAVIRAAAAEPLTRPQQDTILFLDAEKARGMERIREQYAVTLSGITDMPASLMRELIEPAGPKAPTQETQGAVRFPPE